MSLYLSHTGFKSLYLYIKLTILQTNLPSYLWLKRDCKVIKNQNGQNSFSIHLRCLQLLRVSPIYYFTTRTVTIVHQETKWIVKDTWQSHLPEVLMMLLKHREKPDRRQQTFPSPNLFPRGKPEHQQGQTAKILFSHMYVPPSSPLHTYKLDHTELSLDMQYREKQQILQDHWL